MHKAELENITHEKIFFFDVKTKSERKKTGIAAWALPLFHFKFFLSIWMAARDAIWSSGIPVSRMLCVLATESNGISLQVNMDVFYVFAIAIALFMTLMSNDLMFRIE